MHQTVKLLHAGSTSSPPGEIAGGGCCRGALAAPHLVPAVFEDLLFSLPSPVLSVDAQAVKLLHTGSTSYPAGEIVGDWMLQKSTWYPS